MNYLNELNEAQQKAVLATDGPIMVIAGAGSGKTRVLTYRIAHLIKNGVEPFEILALTFTNKAANEMKERISKIVGGTQSKGLWMGTFHSVFAKILRSEAEKIGYPSNFTIYDTQDSKNLIKTIIKEFGLDDKIYKPGLVYNRISMAKNNLISPAAYLSNSVLISEDTQSLKPKLIEIYQAYDKRCFQAGAMDFDDLLFKTNILLRDFPEVKEKYQQKFRYILVDEYQDTNFSQYLIVKKLSELHRNICVVGDDAQSIYAFRGANIQNILNFKNDYPDVKTFKLEQNYRSTKNIVHAANSVIEKNIEQLKKEVWTANQEGEKIKVYKCASDNEEGKLVSNLIFDAMHYQQLHPKDFAVLYRTNAQSRALEEALRRKNIPYKIYGGLSFYQRKEVKDLLAYFRLTVNPKDEEAFKRIVNYPARGIGKTTIDKLTIISTNNNQSIWETIQQPMLMKEGGINSGAIRKLSEFSAMMHSFNSQLQVKNAYDLGYDIATTTGLLKDLYADRTPEGISRYENIQELINGLKTFVEQRKEQEKIPSLIDYLQDVALLTDQDTEKEEDKNKVTLMTIHAAKGLEFPYVFIVGLEENLFPSQLSLSSKKDLEEERRLFYVAITRAEKNLTLSFASSRYRWGNLIYCEPSQFIEEIDPKFVEFKYDTNKTVISSTNDFSKEFNSYNATQTKNYSKPVVKKEIPVKQIKQNLTRINTANNGKSDSAATLNLTEGMTVRHEKFGKGIITQLEGVKPNQKATIEFDKAGKKQLLLKFAKLSILNK
ncbi:MAG: 3'-5' exonuclease [Vicingaceae bacterium]